MTLSYDPHVASTRVERVRRQGRETERDELAVEEPLDIRVDGEALAVTMRTPGEDEELAVGLLIGGMGDVVGVGPTEDLARNVVDVRTRAGLRRDPRDERRFYLSSSCGVCGNAALEFVGHAAPRAAPAPPLDPRVVEDAPERARAAQLAFERTGGLHATALFDSSGEMLVLREDVGRHNAMDKAIGALALAVGAPSTLAVDLARERGATFDVYAGAERLGRAAR